MATYAFYDSEGTIAVSGIDPDAIALWGSAAAVRWFDISHDQIAQLNSRNMLEITVKNLSMLLTTQFSIVTRDFTPTELQKRTSVITNPSKENIALRVLKEGNNARFVFRLHAETVRAITRNLTMGLRITLGVKDGKISLVMKQYSPIVIIANGDGIISIPSGGAKIP
jgi:hypothetical protein